MGGRPAIMQWVASLLPCNGTSYVHGVPPSSPCIGSPSSLSQDYRDRCTYVKLPPPLPPPLYPSLPSATSAAARSNSPASLRERFVLEDEDDEEGNGDEEGDEEDFLPLRERFVGRFWGPPAPPFFFLFGVAIPRACEEEEEKEKCGAEAEEGAEGKEEGEEARAAAMAASDTVSGKAAAAAIAAMDMPPRVRVSLRAVV